MRYEKHKFASFDRSIYYVRVSYSGHVPVRKSVPYGEMRGKKNYP